MTLWGAPPKLGLGIWNFPAAALALELSLLLASALVCLRSGAIAATRRRAVLSLVAGLAVLQLVTTLAPPAFGPSGVAVTVLFAFAAIALAARFAEG
jgi:hypothetical protein